MKANVPPKGSASGVEWNKGIIGRWESFFRKRYGCGPMWSRALGTFIVSCALENAVLQDKMGDVRPNIYIVDIGRTGLGIKSPTVNRVVDAIRSFDANIIGPSRFTPEGLVKYVTGAKAKKDSKGETVDEGEEGHRNFVIINDELSRILADRKREHMSGNDETMSEVWDGYLPPYRTVGRGKEGGVHVYASLLGASSYWFLTLLDEYFFMQGLGNRILWVDEEVKPPKFGEDFFYGGGEDKEWEELKSFTVESLQSVRKYCRTVLMPFNDEWREWGNKLRNDVFSRGMMASRDEEYRVKQILNSLKLAMCYAASTFSYNEGNETLLVSKENLGRAVEDTEKYVDMWRSLMKKWEKHPTGSVGKAVEEDQDLIERFIREAGSNGIVKSKLTFAVHNRMVVKRLNELLDVLESSHLIKIEERKGQTGRAPEVITWIGKG